MADEVNCTMMEVDLKRMGENSIGKPFVIGLRDDGKRSVYSIGGGSEGRYFGEAGGSGKSMIHQFGDVATVPYTIGVNIGAGVEIVGTVRKIGEDAVD